MYSLATIAKIKKVQLGLQYLALMQYTAFMWPKQAVVEDGDKFDFIIVGAGTAGCVIANRLTEDDNINVLLIEAGGDPPVESVRPGLPLFLKRSQYDWNYTTTYDRNMKKCHQKPFFEASQGKMLGGTSSLNYMVYTRGHPTDYNEWAKLTHDASWEWENVLPYFIKSEAVEDPDILRSENAVNYGITGYLKLTRDDREYVKDILKSFEELGHEIHEDPGRGLGYSKMLLGIESGIRQSSAIAYLSTAKTRKNLHVLKNTVVTKINFDEDKHAVGVDAVTEDGETITLHAIKEVILSAGAFNSPKLLMLSGVGPKEQLSCKNIEVISDLPVGKNLQDHVSVMLPIAMGNRDDLFVNPTKLPAAPLIGFTALDQCHDFPDYQTSMFNTNNEMILHFCAFGYRLNKQICDDAYLELAGKMGMYTEVTLLNPKSRGEVKLMSSDPMDPPMITSGYLSNEEDLDDLVKYTKDFLKVMNTTYFKEIDAEYLDVSLGCDHEPGTDEYWRCYASCMFTGMSNYAGTCAMGSVVDNKLRVYGVKGLRVADASVMPTITKGNPQGPIVMIGEKVADLIKQDLVPC